MSKAAVKALQDALNAFTRRYVTGIAPLKVDGEKGSATNQRIRDCKYWLGYARKNISVQVGKGLLAALAHPRNPRYVSPASIARGIRRRIAERRRHRPRKARGIDVSNNQGHVDFAKVAKAGYEFVWVKATEGATFRDPYFLSNVQLARAQRLKVGAYHFLSAGSTIDAQVAAFVDCLHRAGLGHGDLLPVVDVEEKGVTPQMAGQFVRQLERATGIRPLIYTYPSFATWRTTYGCKLWIADYGVPQPVLPKPWTSRAAWQCTSSASVPGVNGRCDVNVTDNLQELIA